jgi:exosortase/archaeosortase family protein
MRKEWLLILGAMLVAGALYNHYMGHSALLIELIMLGCGAGLVLLSARYHSRDEEEPAQSGILYRLLTKAIGDRWANHLVPMIGFALLLGWSAYKIVAVGETNLRMEDIIVTLFGFSLVLYEAGPSKIQQIKDFIALYLLFLVIVFVVIWKSYSLLTGESYYRITAYAEYYVVTSPVVSILQLFGFQVNAVLDLDGIGLSNIIEYFHDGRLLRVGIGVGCSGLYSAGLFFSAFLAFVLVRYEKVDKYIGAALVIGFMVTWLSNIIRMIVTVMAGILWGHPALALVHAYIGILIFVSLITVFWMLIARWLDTKELTEEPPKPSQEEGSEESLKAVSQGSGAAE